MIRLYDPDSGALEALRVQPCENAHGETWARVWTARGESIYVSNIRWPLAWRLVPQLLARYGVPVPAGLWWGTIVVFVRAAS